MLKYCECGCGEKVRSRFVSGHNQRGVLPWNAGKKLSISHRINIGEGGKGVFHNISDVGRAKLRECGRKTSQRVRVELSPLKGRKLSAEHKRKVSEGVRKAYLEGKYKPKTNNSKWYSNTSIEKIMENELKIIGLNYKKQHHIIGIGYVDFFLPDFNIIIECDGDYWHNLPGAQEKDVNRDFGSTFLHKYKTIRFWEHEINDDTEGCIKRLREEIKMLDSQ